MAATEPNIIAFLDALKAYYKADGERLDGAKGAYLIFPEELEKDDIAFSNNAEVQYRDVLKDLNKDQDPMKLLTVGNSFYYMKSLCKSHRMFRRDRIADAMVTLSYSRAMGIEQPVTVLENIATLGTAITPVTGDKK